MNIQRPVLYKSLVAPFYRQNAGLLGFFYYMMTLAVGRANGAGLLEYHYALIRGIMTSDSFYAAVLAAWLIYAIKCSQFIIATLQKPAFSYLYMLSLTTTRHLYWLLLQAQLVLFLPVLSYVIVMMGVGYHEHWYIKSTLLLPYNLAVCALSARVYLYLLRNPGAMAIKWKLPTLFKRKYYTNFLTRYILENHKVLFLVIKIYNCATLYLSFYGRNPARHEDLRMEVLFFSVGVLGHGVLIHRLKEMENNRMAFYRGLPISLNRRFVQYAWLYFCLFIPEIITILSRTPDFLYYSEACFFIFFGYGILLLLNSLQLYNYTGLKDYLKTIAQIFFAVIIAMVSRQLYALSVLFFVLSVIIFFRRYYLFEPRQINALQ